MLNYIELSIMIDTMIARQSQWKPKETIIQTSVRLPEKVHTDLKVIAAKEGKSLNLLLEEIVMSYIAKFGKGK